MNVTRLGVARFHDQSPIVGFGIVAEMAGGGREIVICGGYPSERSATLNVGAALGRYQCLFLYDNEYPIAVGRSPASYSLRGASALCTNACVMSRRTYWTALDNYTIIAWYDHRNVFIG